MNKNDLVAVVASAAGLSKADAAKAVDGVFTAITDALKTGDEVRLVGFGTFAVSERAKSEGRNPRTGTEVDIAPGRAVRFKPGRELQALDKPADVRVEPE